MTQNKILGALQEVGLSRAETLDTRATNLQRVALAISASGVLVSGAMAVYGLAMAEVLVIVLWFRTWGQQLKFRHAGEQARRARLLADGLGISLDARDLSDLIEAACVSSPELKKFCKPEFFSSRAKAGEKRLAEMIEESAWWSSRLYRCCADRTRLFFWVALLISFGVLSLSLPFARPAIAMAEFRVLFVVLAFLVSAEVLARAWMYQLAEREVQRVELLLRHPPPPNTDAHGRLLHLMGDYNAAVEMAPLMLKGIYAKHQRDLNNRWDDRNKGGSAASAP